MITKKFTGILTAFACALLAGTSLAAAADVTFERLANPEPQNWLMNHRDYGSQRFSPLEIINKGNVKGLKLAYAVPLGGTSARDWATSGYPRVSVAGGPMSFCPTSVSTTATRWPVSRQRRVRKRQYVLLPRSTAPRTRILRHLCCTIWSADQSQAGGISSLGSIVLRTASYPASLAG